MAQTPIKMSADEQQKDPRLRVPLLQLMRWGGRAAFFLGAGILLGYAAGSGFIHEANGSYILVAGAAGTIFGGICWLAYYG